MLNAHTTTMATKGSCQMFNELATHLIGERVLSKQYFRDEAMRLGIDDKHVHNWILQKWLDPTHPERLLPAVLLQRIKVMLAVLERVQKYSHCETYPDAMNRLGEKIRHLLEQGASYRAMSQSSGQFHRTLKLIAGRTWNNDNCANRRICPWEILDALDRMPRLPIEAIRAAPERRRTKQQSPPRTIPEYDHRDHDQCPQCHSHNAHRQTQRTNVLSRTKIYICHGCGLQFIGPAPKNRVHRMVDGWMRVPVRT